MPNLSVHNIRAQVRAGAGAKLCKSVLVKSKLQLSGDPANIPGSVMGKITPGGC